MSESITVEFLTKQNAVIHALNITDAIDDATSISFERDFFIPADGGTIVLEDNRASQLNGLLKRGMKLRISINDNPIMFGYIFKLEYAITHNGGYSLTIHFKDLLEYMAKGSVPPNMGTGSQTAYHFNATDTMQTAIATIVGTFGIETDTQSLTIDVEDGNQLTFATGFALGLRAHGKTAKRYQHSLQSSLNHLTTAEKGESYLAYMLRLAKHIGAEIKMAPASDDTIIVQSPTYDRVNATPYKLYHYISAPNNALNNMLDIFWDWDHEEPHSCIIVEMNTQGNGSFNQANMKAVAMNELVAYPLDPLGDLQVPGLQSTSITPVYPLPTVNSFVSQLVSGTLGTGYQVVPPKQDLYDVRKTLPIDTDMEMCLPQYVVDCNAHTIDELCFAAAKMMAEQQDRMVTLKTTVAGWTTSGVVNGQVADVVWYPNNLCQVTDEALSPGNPSTGVMWIKRCTWTKTRHEGTKTHMELTLPYTHPTEITL